MVFQSNHRLIARLQKATSGSLPTALRHVTQRYHADIIRVQAGGPNNIPGTGAPYPPININVLPSQPSAPGLDISATDAAVGSKAMNPLEIPGPRDEAVKEYGEWQVSNVTDGTLKAAFRQVCDLMLESGLDLEQVYKDRDPEFFISKGIKMGIARRFVDDIRGWVENVKKAMPTYEMI